MRTLKLGDRGMKQEEIVVSGDFCTGFVAELQSTVELKTISPLEPECWEH